MSGKEEVAEILMESIPREFFLNFERYCSLALERAQQIGQMADEGHRAYVVGQNRHLFLNEALMNSLDECGISHTPLRGNRILVGKVGIAAVARVHMNCGKWDNSRRSKAKVKLCAPNRKVTTLVQVDWVQSHSSEEPKEIEAITVFLVTQGDGTALSPSQVFITVPDANMDFRNPIFAESVSIFLQRYQQVQDVADTAQPRLKSHIKKKPKEHES